MLIDAVKTVKSTLGVLKEMKDSPVFIMGYLEGLKDFGLINQETYMALTRWRMEVQYQNATEGGGLQ